MRHVMTRAILVLALALPALASAEPGAMAALKKGQARIDGILETDAGKKPPEVWKPKLREAVNAFIDFGELARRALGSHWDDRTPEEQKAFQSTMKALVEAAYLARVKERGDYEVVYERQTVAEGGEVVVSTVLKAKDAKIPVEYKLYRKEGTWLVYDIVTDGLSLLENYRSQFNRLIKRKGFDGLMDTLERKRAELERDGT